MTAITHTIYDRLDPRIAWKLAGFLLVLGAYLAPGRQVRHGAHGKFRRQPRLTAPVVLFWHYLVALTESEESAIARRRYRVLGRAVVAAAVVGAGVLVGV